MMRVEQHLNQMIREAYALEGQMNNAGCYYLGFLGHITHDERARVGRAFNAMVLDYAQRHGITLDRADEGLPTDKPGDRSHETK